MWKRLVAVVVVLGVLGGAVAVVSLTGTHSTSTNLRKLPFASAAGTAEGKSTSMGAAAPNATGDMVLAPGPTTVDYTVKGELPALDGKAPAYELSGPGGIDDVQTLADAAGLTGQNFTKGDYSVISGPAGGASLQHGGMRAWSVYRTPADANCTTSSDGTTSCSASGTSKAAIACAVPPCAPDQSCPQPAKCAPPEPPARPADLPTKDSAEQTARELLAKLKVDVSTMSVDVNDAFSSWAVVFTQKLDGQTVPGLVTSVMVGPKSVVQSASGFFAQPVKLGDYPLAGTTVGLERVKAGKFLFGGVAYAMDSGGARTAEATGSAPPVAQAGSGSSGSGSASTPSAPVATVPTRRTVTITGVHLQLSLVPGDNGAGLLVPAYVFEVEGGSVGPAVPAVIDKLLQEPVGGGTVPTAVPLGRPEPAPAPAPPPIDKPTATEPAP